MSDTTEELIIRTIDENRDRLVAFGRDIFTHAELGYKEHRTAGKFAEALRGLGLPAVEEGLAITGVKGYLRQPGTPGPTLALIGELDALRIPEHPDVNPETQAAHACGHNSQLTGVVGAALALSVPEVAERLGGNLVFFAVPSEEYGEIAFKNQLAAEGKIKYGAGKAELIRVGAFDDIDLSVAHHSSGDGISVGSHSSNGFVAKVIRLIGRESHAAAAAEKVVNALNAASLGLTALAYQRETFRDEDAVRVHPILTKGGNLVNVVPNEAVVETLVRAKTAEAVADAAFKVDRAFKAGADAVGAGYEITTRPGYLPRIGQAPDPDVLAAAREAAPDAEVRELDPTQHQASSSDVGDLQHILPVLSFNTGGVAGGFHTKDFRYVDEEEAYIVTAKIFALSAYRLLRDGAAGAHRVVDGYTPVFTKQQYLDYLDANEKVETKEVEG